MSLFLSSPQAERAQTMHVSHVNVSPTKNVSCFSDYSSPDPVQKYTTSVLTSTSSIVFISYTVFFITFSRYRYGQAKCMVTANGL